MPGVIWLASYPKSGSTWLRAFLANYFSNAKRPVPINELPKFIFGDGVAAPYEQVAGRSVEGMDVPEIQRLRLRVHQMFATSSPDTVFVKTHNAIAFLDGVPTINPDATAGAIYIIRNPLDVCVSYRHHYGITIERAITALGSEDTQVPGQGHLVHQFLGSWSGHVRSWCDAPGLNPHVVRYEDMLMDPEKTFRALAGFLGLPTEMGRLRRAIRFSSFGELSGQERKGGFVESVPVDDRVFFRKGKTGDWRDTLSGDQARRIIDDHRAVMAKYGYLDERGGPVF